MILILLFLAVTNPRTNLIPISYISLASSGSSFISSQVIVLERRTLFKTIEYVDGIHWRAGCIYLLHGHFQS